MAILDFAACTWLTRFGIAVDDVWLGLNCDFAASM